MNHFYPYSLPYDEVLWDFSRWIPDLVVINLGTNDFHLGPPPEEEFIRAYLELIGTVRDNYPDVPIICMISAMFDPSEEKTAPSGPYRSGVIMEQYMNDLLSEAEKMGITSLYLFRTPNRMRELGYGANYHPGKAQHQADGEALADFIRTLMGW